MTYSLGTSPRFAFHRFPDSSIPFVISGFFFPIIFFDNPPSTSFYGPPLPVFTPVNSHLLYPRSESSRFHGCLPLCNLLRFFLHVTPLPPSHGLLSSLFFFFPLRWVNWGRWVPFFFRIFFSPKRDTSFLPKMSFSFFINHYLSPKFCPSFRLRHPAVHISLFAKKPFVVLPDR